MIPELAMRLARRSVVSAMALLALAAGATHALGHSPIAQRSSVGSRVSGTIVTANAHELLVSTARGERVVLKLESRTIGLRHEASTSTDPRASVAASLGAPEAPPPAADRADLLPWTSSTPLILPILGLFAIGTAGAVAIGRRVATIPTQAR